MQAHERERTGSFIKCGLHCMKLVQYTLIILLLPHGFFTLHVAKSMYINLECLFVRGKRQNYIQHGLMPNAQELQRTTWKVSSAG